MTTAADHDNRRAAPDCWLTDMDGVLWHEGRALPGAADFLARLKERGRRFLVLTNNSAYTPGTWPPASPELVSTCRRGVWTSALATADFLSRQMPHGSAYVVGGRSV